MATLRASSGVRGEAMKTHKVKVRERQLSCDSKLIPQGSHGQDAIELDLDDEQALEVPDLYPVYEVDHAYKKDERFTYNGRLFKVNQDHTSAAVLLRLAAANPNHKGSRQNGAAAPLT